MTIKSNSWKITKPLRLAARTARWFMRGSIAWITLSLDSRPRRIIKRILIYSKYKINKQPKLKIFAKILLLPFPKLKYRLRHMRHDYIKTKQKNRLHYILSPKAKRIYSNLKTAIENKNRENQ